jgi:glycerate-2-kinase
VVAIAGAAIEAVSAGRLVSAAIAASPPQDRSPIFLLAVGKAASPMAASFVATSPVPVTRGLVIGTHGTPPAGLTFIESAHPIPDERSEAAARAALALAADCPPDGRLVVLVSGGASALMALPAAGLSLRDKGTTVRQLLAGGADITALNCVRKHLSAIKGGRLAAACPGHVDAWLLSDVVGDDPSVIGSGPTVPDPSTYAQALAVLDRFGGRSRFPDAIVAHLEAGARGSRPETPKASTDLPRASTRVIGSAEQARAGAAAKAGSLGYDVVIRAAPVVGEARDAVAAHLGHVRHLVAGRSRPTCIVSSGETTVQVRGRGRGGRNQEFALAAALELAAGAIEWTVASVGTDGVDGPTDAAGACADGATCESGRRAGLDASASLADNDSWTFFDRVGGLIRTGPTDTNVGDLQVVIVGDRRPT